MCNRHRGTTLTFAGKDWKKKHENVSQGNRWPYRISIVRCVFHLGGFQGCWQLLRLHTAASLTDNERVWSKSGKILTGKSRVTGTENCNSATLYTTKTTQTDEGSNPDVRVNVLYVQNFYWAHKQPGLWLRKVLDGPGFESGQRQLLFVFSKCPNPFWGPLSVLLKKYRVFFSGRDVKLTAHINLVSGQGWLELYLYSPLTCLHVMARDSFTSSSYLFIKRTGVKLFWLG